MFLLIDGKETSVLLKQFIDSEGRFCTRLYQFAKKLEEVLRKKLGAYWMQLGFHLAGYDNMLPHFYHIANAAENSTCLAVFSAYLLSVIDRTFARVPSLLSS
ncbi:MAG: hypothetical protein AABW64_00850 [Nanoarchaeota archaeon]